MARWRGRLGFTMIEVALVTVVLVILLVASLPRFQQTVERLRVEHQTFELLQILRYARERAVAQSQDVLWVWDPRERRAQVEWIEEAGQPPTPIAEQAARSNVLAPRVSLHLNDQHGDPIACGCVQFFADGTATFTRVILETNGRVLYTIQVDETTGEPKLSAGTASR